MWKAVYLVVVRWIAMLGGYLGRANDPPPGPKAMRVGRQKARTLALGWETFGPGAKNVAES